MQKFECFEEQIGTRHKHLDHKQACFLYELAMVSSCSSLAGSQEGAIPMIPQGHPEISVELSFFLLLFANSLPVETKT